MAHANLCQTCVVDVLVQLQVQFVLGSWKFRFALAKGMHDVGMRVDSSVEGSTQVFGVQLDD